MKTVIHKAAERGHANLGWLNSYHSFSFSSYQDAAKMNFGALRVLNDDTVRGGMGFGKHPHENMEIISIPLQGDLHHKDSTGRDKIIKQGDVQIMSAGSGISHSEANASKTDEVRFLQIWIYPKEYDITPRYEQKTFEVKDRQNKWQTVVAPDYTDAVLINQDAWLSLSNLSAGNSMVYDLHKPANGLYVFLIEGEANYRRP